VSTGVRHPHRIHRPHRWVVWLIVALVAAPVAALGLAVAVDRAFFAQATQACRLEPTRTPRPELQRILEGAVQGASMLAPGATAYVSGPHGTWSGAAGVADTTTCARMAADARVRLESVSKIYAATLVLRLARERRLRLADTVATWLPGLLPYGSRITIRQLLTMSSGLIDNNDLRNAPASVQRTYLSRVKDAGLRTRVAATLARVEEDPAAVVPEIFWIRWAAWQPLLFAPGAGHHYSNIGYDILGLIAARAGDKPLAALYDDRIFEPLGLHATAYDPQGPIRGPHAEGYGIEPNGTWIDTTDWHWGVGAEGGIVSNARETAAFLAALMRGKLLDRQALTAMKGDDFWQGGAYSGCDDPAFGWSGGGSGFKTEVWVNGDGSRVAVLLLNGRHYDTAQAAADQAAHDALASLYCGA
jgi:D-alanyl-D-alanine carboxypeptidase